LTLRDLRKLRVFVNRAKPFIVAEDHHPSLQRLDSRFLENSWAPTDGQMQLFAPNFAGAA
jgi:predicted DNA-binding helix-hairpin-helix protein